MEMGGGGRRRKDRSNDRYYLFILSYSVLIEAVQLFGDADSQRRGVNVA